MQCGKCGTQTKERFRYCPKCGADLEQPAEVRHSTKKQFQLQRGGKKANLRVVLVKEFGTAATSMEVGAGGLTVGRENCDLQPEDDPFLSPLHASFYFENEKLFVRDEQSVNGVFVRIKKKTPLRAKATFLVGEQLLQFDPWPNRDVQDLQDNNGTAFLGSQDRPVFFVLTQILRGGDIGMNYCAPSPKVSLGKHGNDINYPDDPFISGRHALIVPDKDGYYLADEGSANGTYVRIKEPRELTDVDSVFIGRHLFRIEAS